MKIIRYHDGKRSILGLWEGDEVLNLAELDSNVFSSFTKLSLHAHDQDKSVPQMITEYMESGIKKPSIETFSKIEDRLLMPLDPVEVWTCGVTYSRSQEAREFETGVKGIYDLVYDAERPEIFFKTTGIRCVGPNKQIGIRGDSNWNVPEPELAFILGPNQQVIGFTAGNDVSSREIEGENPLYLPQAKIFEACCALGPSIVTVDEVGSEPELKITGEIIRGRDTVFKGSTNTSKMKRSIEELRSYLCRFNLLPPVTVCLTGTGIVPPDDFTLLPNDTVKITIDKIGTLTNTVKMLG